MDENQMTSNYKLEFEVRCANDRKILLSILHRHRAENCFAISRLLTFGLPVHVVRSRDLH